MAKIFIISFLVAAIQFNVDVWGGNSDCLECHENPEKCKEYGDLEKTRIEPGTGEIYIVSMIIDEGAFATSAHGGRDFSCIDCHTDLEDSEGMHKPDLKFVDCITFCHDEPGASYLESNHVKLMKEKGYTPPSCKHCHIGLTFHQATWGKERPMFVPHADSVTHRKLTIETCSDCHQDYYKAYKNNFHGQVAALGYTDTKVPTCADCHGSHDILNSLNPESLMGLSHRVEVCGKCHEGADEKFVNHIEHPKIKDVGFYKTLISALKDIRKDPQKIKNIGKDPQTILFIVFVGYIGLLSAIFSTFGLHSLLTWFRTIMDERKGEDGEKHEK